MTNKEILLKANEAVTNGDNERFLELCTDDVIWTFIGDQELRGKNAVRAYMNETYIEPPSFAVEELIAEGEFVTAVGKIALKNEDGVIVNYAYCDVWRFSGGKMAELKAFVIVADQK